MTHQSKLQRAFDSSPHLCRLAVEAAIEDGRGSYQLPVVIVHAPDHQTPWVRGEASYTVCRKSSWENRYIGITYPSTREVAVPEQWAEELLKAKGYDLTGSPHKFIELTDKHVSSQLWYKINYLREFHPSEATYLDQLFIQHEPIPSSLPKIIKYIQKHGPTATTNEFLRLYFLQPFIQKTHRNQRAQDRKPHKHYISEATYTRLTMQQLDKIPNDQTQT